MSETKRFSLSEKRNILRKLDKNVGVQYAFSEHLELPTSILAAIVKQRAKLKKNQQNVVKKIIEIKKVIESHSSFCS